MPRPSGGPHPPKIGQLGSVIERLFECHANRTDTPRLADQLKIERLEPVGLRGIDPNRRTLGDVIVGVNGKPVRRLPDLDR